MVAYREGEGPGICGKGRYGKISGSEEAQICAATLDRIKSSLYQVCYKATGFCKDNKYMISDTEVMLSWSYEDSSIINIQGNSEGFTTLPNLC
jgi:hypothetical protein